MFGGSKSELWQMAHVYVFMYMENRLKVVGVVPEGGPQRQEGLSVVRKVQQEGCLW